MRKIEFQEPDHQAWRNWVARCEAAREDDIATVQRGEALQKSVLYKAKKEEFICVDGPFRGKCAYCEQKIRGSQRGDIEHYRPKSAVKDFEWSEVSRQTDVETQKHPGYYWLRQTLSNLLLSCELCNQINVDENGKYGKECRFPVEGDHAWEPGGEAEERPQLLNPCVDDPSEHIEMDRSSGALCGRHGKQSPGQITIDLLGLNYRDLPKDRKDAYASAANDFYMAMALVPHDREEAARKLAKLRNDDSLPFTFARQLALKDAASSYVETVNTGMQVEAA